MLGDTSLCIHPDQSNSCHPTIFDPINCLYFFPVFELEDLDWDHVTDLFWEIFMQIEQIWKAAGSEVCDCREEPVHEVQLQHRGCHGDEHGLQRCTERAGLPPG